MKHNEQISVCPFEISQASEEQWNEIPLQFRDGTVYQTWGYGAVRCRKGRLCNLVLKKDCEIRAAAQVRILTVPVIAAGSAYVHCGPLWKLRDRPDDPDSLRQIVAALKREFVDRRGLSLRIRPNAYGIDEDAKTIESILEGEGYRTIGAPGETIILDLTPSLDLLRLGMDRRWRANLKHAETQEYRIIQGNELQLFDRFAPIYTEMMDRKRFDCDISLEDYRIVQRDLPDSQKPGIVLCEINNEAVAGFLFSKIGETAIGMLAATSNRGIKLNAAYLVWWNSLKWLKAEGLRRLDLGGIDKAVAPGPYQFKMGLAAKCGRTTTCIGPYEACSNLISLCALRFGVRLRKRVHHLCHLLGG